MMWLKTNGFVLIYLSLTPGKLTYMYSELYKGVSSSDIVTGQDTETLLPVQPPSGVSACPGQDVTINCTIVRMTSLSGAEQPTLTWVYRDIRLIYRAGVLQPTSDSLNNGVYTAVFSYSHFYVNSVATILNVPLSHHNSSIRCLIAGSIPNQVNTKIAGQFKTKMEMCDFNNDFKENVAYGGTIPLKENV